MINFNVQSVMCREIKVIVVLMTMIICITHYNLLCDGVKTECFVEDGTDPIDHCILPLTKCHSLNDLPSVLNANGGKTQAMLCSIFVTLHLHLELQKKHNISLIGYPTTLSCSDEGGLTINDSGNISIINITFDHCGVLHNSTSVDIANKTSLLLFRSAVYILNSTDIRLKSVTISHTNGLGLAFIDTGGSIDVTNCTFANNSVNENETEVIAGGGGVYIEFTYCLPSQYGTEECDRHPSTDGSIYRFYQTTFTDNIGSSINRKQTDFIFSEKSTFLGLGRGGGLNVVFRGTATQNTVILNQCKFVNNSAIWGGGLKVTFSDEVSQNSFVAYECLFDSNKCLSHAGGGADVGFSYISHPFPHENNMRFDYCNFSNNIAVFGGGIAFYSSSGAHENLSNTIEFKGCVWSHNRARYGSAVDISTHAWATVGSGHRPSPKFEDSIFFENYVIHNSNESQNKRFSFYNKGKAAFLATEFTLNFFGIVNFTNNNGSALVLVSSVAIFKPNANVVFDNNIGFNGGAIALIGFSVLTLSDNMSFILSNNKAIRCGGAIYSYSIDNHDFVSSRTCFFHNDNVFKNEMWMNSFVTFVNNSAGTFGTDTSIYCGHSICATTLLPCFYACKKNTEDKVKLEETFMCFANFTFSGSNSQDGKYELITSGAYYNMSVDSSEPIKIIPGKEESLPIALFDDLEQSIDAAIFLDIYQNREQSVKLDRSYTFLSDNKTVFQGLPNTTAFLTLSTTHVQESSINFKVIIQSCPPGYINNLKENRCVCSASSKQFYSPVYTCDNKEFVAIVRHGYWIGYINGETEDDLLYSYCPGKRCFYNAQHSSSHKLTGYASKVELDKLVCGNESTGIMCSACREGYSTNYHSSDLVCSKGSCELGWLFYILSEIIPITVLFLIVIALNISFTTGELNGFIFFAQMFDSVSTTAHGFIPALGLPNHAVAIARLFYLFFNFDFFRHNKLSFCLWSGANSLDMLAFKYVTVAYAMLLIAVVIGLINRCNVYQRIYCLRASTMRSSITHGLSAFLVVVYAQCATISFEILAFTYLYSKGHVYNRTVVTHLGDVPYFHPRHLRYAIPALFCVIFVVVLPTIILLLYPSCFKVTSAFHLGDYKCGSWMLQKIPHAYLKPFADSFQSCFKDNLRFFAGLYFVYRLALLISWVTSSLITQRFMLLQFLFTSMLLVHSIFQPYKKKFHNMLDSIMFFILSVINGITVYNYHYAKIDFTKKIGTDALIHIQAFLAYLPLIYFVIFMIASILRKLKNFNTLKVSSMSIRLNWLTRKSGSDDDLPSRLKDEIEESSEGSIDYQDYNDHNPKTVETTY